MFVLYLGRAFFYFKGVIKVIRYLVDKEKKYTEDLLFTLRAHNKSCTGEKANESLYIYVIKNDQLLGGTRINFS
jgi:hypothetical protein